MVQKANMDYTYRHQHIDGSLYGARDLATDEVHVVSLKKYQPIQPTFQGHDLWKANWTKKTLEEVLFERAKNLGDKDDGIRT